MKQHTAEAIGAIFADLFLAGMAIGLSFAVAAGIAWAIVSVWPIMPYWPTAVGIFLSWGMLKSLTRK